MKRYKKCYGQCVECLHFYTIEGCEDIHNSKNTFIQLKKEDLDRLISLFETLKEDGYVVWVKEIKRRIKLRNITSLTKNKTL